MSRDIPVSGVSGKGWFEPGNPGNMALIGNIAPDAVPTPMTLIGTFAFGNFTASASYAPLIASLLTRNAKRRMFIIKNGLNQPLTTLSFFPNDSLAPNTSTALGTSIVLATPPVAGIQCEYDSLQQPGLAFPGNSFVLSMGMGVTAPTSGNVTVYVTEVL